MIDAEELSAEEGAAITSWLAAQPTEPMPAGVRARLLRSIADQHLARTSEHAFHARNEPTFGAGLIDDPTRADPALMSSDSPSSARTPDEDDD